ncbi:MAG: 5-amino-6-(D-ribitylamino)uracil--L-tyrosine 4-hydroxyphenyl transferase CofH [Rhodospirillales bacterium]|jgi:FO synthase|nr:5-amino-6-(D-ribitylamino)uracil--L-tyrosine 4-hydroxyphenyl transferase CofH [Rhodospirillales bacterium]
MNVIRSTNLSPDIEALTSRDINDLLSSAASLRDQGHGSVVTYSRKVFIPLTQLCRDVCHYCTFAQVPKAGQRAYMTAEEVLEITRQGQAAGCKEALFTLGDKPELRFRVAADELKQMGYGSTLEYVASMAELVFKETGLLPHINPGVMNSEEMKMLKSVSVSMGLMLESASERLCEKGGPHYGSPDKVPSVRLETLRLAGELGVPMTSGILIGIGETREECISSLCSLRDLHERYGHIQEIIVQNFRAKPGTKMSDAQEPGAEYLLWAIAVARHIFGPEMSIQAPPNLSPGQGRAMIDAGINDWGGVSPVTPDFVNPEAPWPQIEALSAETAKAGKTLVERLAIYPKYIFETKEWLEPKLRSVVFENIDADGYARTDSWLTGSQTPLPDFGVSNPMPHVQNELSRLLSKAGEGLDLSHGEVEILFASRGGDFTRVCEAADALRRDINGDTITYAVNRNINYTNVCYFHCGFCAFSKGKKAEELRGKPYDLDMSEILRRVGEARARGATEVCMQGGIHPSYTGETYLNICRSVKQAFPDIHIHAFSPLEIWHGAETLGMSLPDYLGKMREAGLGTLPGTAAEILDDEIRDVICKDKINAAQWGEVVMAAHQVGIKTTSTIMFGHVERPVHWARHLLLLRDIQKTTGGITEFVPLPFVHMEAPFYLKNAVRKGPTFREAVLMHAVARLALHPHITNIQTSWTKMGPEGAKACLNAGCNDLGGTLMNESISRAAGSSHGQEMPPEDMEALIASMGRNAKQRTTLYETPPICAQEASFNAAPLNDIINTPLKKGK